MEFEYLAGKPILYRPNVIKENLIDWAEEFSKLLDGYLNSKGVVLIRGLPIENGLEFHQLFSALIRGDIEPYLYRSTPRTEVHGNIYTATEYPSSEVIPQHSENAYADEWPLRLGFLALLPAVSGGNTPLADNRKILDAIPKDVVERFKQKSLKYVRNYGELDLPWSDVFQTSDHIVVEEYCKKHKISFEWLNNGGLRTWQINSAIQTHPVSGELVWFNQAHLFHISSMDEEVRGVLCDEFGKENLPRNVYFGDGDEISDDDLEHIRNAFKTEMFDFAWEKGDLLMIDNMHFTHGRQPYQGNRKILVGMGKIVSAINNSQ